jgi:hypothetical protein
MESAQFSSELDRSPALRQAMHRYAYVLMSQLGGMAACARDIFERMLQSRLNPVMAGV